MRKIKCDDKGCKLESKKHSELEGGQANISFMAGETNGLTPSEGTYMIPIRQASAHSVVKIRKKKSPLSGGGNVQVKKSTQVGRGKAQTKKSTQVGRGKAKAKKSNLAGGGKGKAKKSGAKAKPSKKLQQAGFGKGKAKKGSRNCVKGRK